MAGTRPILRRTPIAFYGHNYRGNSVKFPIGTATVTKDVANRRLLFDITFTDATDDAKTVKQLVDEGVLRTCSVGFIPEKYNVMVNTETNMVVGREYVQQKLLEISVVSLPADPNAVRLAMGKGLVTKAQAETWGLMDDQVSVLMNTIAELKN
jgi:HK97 family phage prohead protease